MKQLEDMVRAELEEMAEMPGITMELPRLLIYMLIAQCQIAFRHPQNTGQTRERVGELVEALRGVICEPGSAIDLSIKMGYDSAYDIPGERSCAEGFEAEGYTVKSDDVIHPRAEPPN